MRLFIIPVIFLIAFVFSSCKSNYTYKGLRVKGRYICDMAGNKIVMQGVNVMFAFSKDRDGSITYPEIAKTGANATRIFWLCSIPAIEAEQNIINCIANGMVPIWSVWDATGKWGADLKKCVDYWCDSSALNIIKKYEDLLIINIANEAGNSNMPDYLQVYIRAVDQMRKAGINTPIMIDADGWGRNEKTLLENGQMLLDADPNHNLIFSWHAWNVNYEIEPVLQKSVELDLPFVVGEFSEKSVGCDCCINYKDIMEFGQQYEIGWLAWSWGIVPNGDCSEMDMTDADNPVFETLQGWGLEVAVTNKFSIKNTSVPLLYHNNNLK